MKRLGSRLLGWAEDRMPVSNKAARKRAQNAFWVGVDAAHHLNVMPWDGPFEETKS